MSNLVFPLALILGFLILAGALRFFNHHEPHH